MICLTWLANQCVPRFAGLHQSNSHLTVCVGFPRCQIWDSLPSLLRLGKYWAWPHGFKSRPRMSCMAQISRRQVRMGHRLTSSWVCPRLAILKFLSERTASGNLASFSEDPLSSVEEVKQNGRIFSAYSTVVICEMCIWPCFTFHTCWAPSFVG